MTENLVSDTGMQAAPESATETAPVSNVIDSSVSSEAGKSESVAQESATTEKLIPQSHVDKIVHGRLKDQASKYERQLAEMQKMPLAQQSQQVQGIGGMNNPSQTEIRQMIQQEAQRMAQVEYATQIANTFTQKISSHLNSDPEFVDVYNDLKLEHQHAYMIPILSELDNMADVIKDMGQNPTKFANILMLMNSGNPEMARRDLKKLSDSISANKNAAKQETAPAPLSQMKPSHLSAGDGRLTTKDFKANPRYRG
jgi:hypothetical protein